MITNIQEYGRDELSLLVFNTERLYKLRFKHDDLRVAIDSQFIYTEDQWHQLNMDITLDVIDNLK